MPPAKARAGMVSILLKIRRESEERRVEEIDEERAQSMMKKAKSAGSHGLDNPLKTAREPLEVHRIPARVASSARSRLSEEDSSQQVKLLDKMLPGMPKKKRIRHSRTAEIQKANPLTRG